MSRNLALVIIFGLSIIGSSFAFGVTAYFSIQALSRNPGKNAPTIFVWMSFIFTLVLACVLIIMLSAYIMYTP